MNYVKLPLKQLLLVGGIIALLVTGCSSPTDHKPTSTQNEMSSVNTNNEMAILAIIELQALPGKREELRAFIDTLVATHGPGGPGFIRSTRYEVVDNPDKLIEIAEWESAEARESHMKAASASGIYAPLKDLLAAPFKVTIIKQLD